MGPTALPSSFVPGQIPDDVIAMVVTVDQPQSTLLAELVRGF
jgi:hypothetical protein